MRFDVYTPSGSRPTQDAEKAAGVGRAAAIYASRQPVAASPHPGASSNADAHSNVSPMGHLLRNLHGLKNNDPQAFSNVTATIANRLYEMAQTEPDDAADHLLRLADRFSMASQAGNLQPLKPPDQTYVRGLRGPAAYAQQRNQDEGARELRLEVQTALHDLLSPFVRQTPDGENTPLLAPEPPSDVTPAQFGDLSVVS